MRRPLLAAKFLVPSLRLGVVPRSRLYERLTAAESARVTIVVAPAGWGKTTLLAGWVAELGQDRSVAWLSLDEADDEPVRFWTYALSAIERVAPHLAEEALAVLRAPGLDPVLLALESLLNACATTPAECVLVLDDYHLLADPVIHNSMEFLLSYLPSGSLRVIIASRSDPPLPLARLRARGELAEIRLDDLRCSPAEGLALISAVADVTVDTATELVHRTEGWPAALQLGALTLRGGTSSTPGHTAGAGRHILDYVAAEVLPALTKSERDLLVRTSVLERLTGSLCDAVLETTGSAAVLEHLARADMFIGELGRSQERVAPVDGRAAYDDGPSWYRCHQLLRWVLRRELDAASPALAAEVLARASNWFLETGRVEEAVAHVLAAGDESAAISILASRTRWFLDHGAMAALLRLGRGPASNVADPHLHLSLAFAAALTGQPDEEVRWLSAAEPLIRSGAPPLPGWRSLRAGADATWAAHLLERDVDEALRHARRAVDLETDPSCWGYVVARLSLAGALVANDQLDAAVRILEETWRLPVRNELPLLLTLQHAGSLALALIESGRLDDGRAVTAEVAAKARDAEEAWGVGAAAALTALRLAEAELVAVSDPVAAIPNLHSAVISAERWGRPSMMVTALLALSASAWTAGERGLARQSLDRAGDLVAHETTAPSAKRRYSELERRIGRAAGSAARTDGTLLEPLTDRELSILRALRGPLSAREIATELFLSINTVKGYTKSLYRKLDVATRGDAVRRGHQLGLI